MVVSIDYQKETFRQEKELTKFLRGDRDSRQFMLKLNLNLKEKNKTFWTYRYKHLYSSELTENSPLATKIRFFLFALESSLNIARLHTFSAILSRAKELCKKENPLQTPEYIKELIAFNASTLDNLRAQVKFHVEVLLL